ncbi:hypothetical protein [Lentzea sp. NPDC055074]
MDVLGPELRGVRRGVRGLTFDQLAAGVAGQASDVWFTCHTFTDPQTCMSADTADPGQDLFRSEPLVA